MSVLAASPALAVPQGPVCGPNGCQPSGPAWTQANDINASLTGGSPTGVVPPTGETGEVTGGDAPPSGGPYTLRRGGCSTCPGSRRISGGPPAPGGFSAEGGGVMAAAGGGGGGCGGKKSCAVRMGGFVQSCRSFLGRLFGGLFGRRGC